jgi:TonB family protein
VPKDRIFKWTLLISLLTHSALFWELPRFNILPSKRVLTKLEVTYYQIKEKPKVTSLAQPPIVKHPLIKEETFKIKQIVQNAFLTEPKKNTVIKAGGEKTSASKVTISKDKAKEGEKKKADDKLSKNPIYLKYTQTLHQKIRQIALKNCPKNFQDGAVFVSFTVSSNGQLKEVKVIDGKSNAENILKEIAQRSIQEAAPFPQFPESFNQPEITFNVIISFETER